MELTTHERIVFHEILASDNTNCFPFASLFLSLFPFILLVSHTNFLENDQTSPRDNGRFSNDFNGIQMQNKAIKTKHTHTHRSKTKKKENNFSCSFCLCVSHSLRGNNCVTTIPYPSATQRPNWQL